MIFVVYTKQTDNLFLFFFSLYPFLIRLFEPDFNMKFNDKSYF
jgi:hypothetical protein